MPYAFTTYKTATITINADTFVIITFLLLFDFHFVPRILRGCIHS